MRSKTINATTIENTAPNAAQQLDERALEAVTGGIIIVGGIPFQTLKTILAHTAAAFLDY